MYRQIGNLKNRIGQGMTVVPVTAIRSTRQQLGEESPNGVDVFFTTIEYHRGFFTITDTNIAITFILFVRHRQKGRNVFRMTEIRKESIPKKILQNNVPCMDIAKKRERKEEKREGLREGREKRIKGRKKGGKDRSEGGNGLEWNGMEVKSKELRLVRHQRNIFSDQHIKIKYPPCVGSIT